MDAWGCEAELFMSLRELIAAAEPISGIILFLMDIEP